ncbi:MAG: ABC transporter substrate-binding protein [Acetobacteraceae bacterium]
MRRRTFTKMIAGTALAASTITAARAAEDLKIGAIGSLSGGGTAWGLALQRGVQLAIEKVNDAGGLKIGNDTYKPRLVMVDDQYAATGGRTAAERLINLEKVKYIIGPIGSPPSLGAVSVTNAAKVLMLSDGFNPNILKNDAHAAYNFRVMNTNVEFGPSMIKWFREHYPQVKKVALVGTNDATGQSVLPALAKVYAANGFDTWIEMFDRGTQEFTPLMTRMIAQNVDALDLNSNSPGDAGLLLKQARQTGFKGKIWQIGGPSVDEIVQVGGPLAEGFLSLEVFNPDDPAFQKFIAAYHAKWSGVMNGQAPLWNNAAEMLFEALRRAGSLDVDKVRDAVEHLEGYNPGLYGPVVWGGMAEYGVNHQQLLPFWIAEVKNGKETIVDTVTPRKA